MGIGDENICLICYEHPPDAVFMECGHGGTSISPGFIYFIGACYECALDIWQETEVCYLCRKVLFSKHNFLI